MKPPAMKRALQRATDSRWRPAAETIAATRHIQELQARYEYARKCQDERVMEELEFSINWLRIRNGFF